MRDRHDCDLIKVLDVGEPLAKLAIFKLITYSTQAICQFVKFESSLKDRSNTVNVKALFLYGPLLSCYMPYMINYFQWPVTNARDTINKALMNADCPL